MVSERILGGVACVIVFRKYRLSGEWGRGEGNLWSEQFEHCWNVKCHEEISDRR
jgi:hypothetical protein